MSGRISNCSSGMQGNTIRQRALSISMQRSYSYVFFIVPGEFWLTNWFLPVYQKLVHKTYYKLVPDEDEEEKSKPPNLYKLLKARLDKVVSKKDPKWAPFLILKIFWSWAMVCSDGRVLSTEFIQLPSRKLWPIYYIEIQKPECFDNIYVCV